ncbi:MAG: hypothetical protein ACOC15_02320 [Desulfovibrionales bacterium]
MQDLGCCDGLYLDQGLKIFQDPETLPEVVASLAGLVDGPVFLSLQEAVQGKLPADPDKTAKHVLEIVRWAPNLVPLLLPDNLGLEVLGLLERQQVAAAVCGVKSVGQGLLAAKSKAALIFTQSVEASPIDLPTRLLSVLDNYAFESELVVAGTLTVPDLEEAGLVGVDGAVVGEGVLQELLGLPGA